MSKLSILDAILKDPGKIGAKARQSSSMGEVLELNPEEIAYIDKAYSTPMYDASDVLAERNASFPRRQGGMGLTPDNTQEQRRQAFSYMFPDSERNPSARFDPARSGQTDKMAAAVALPVESSISPSDIWSGYVDAVNSVMPEAYQDYVKNTSYSDAFKDFSDLIGADEFALLNMPKAWKGGIEDATDDIIRSGVHGARSSGLTNLLRQGAGNVAAFGRGIGALPYVKPVVAGAAGTAATLGGLASLIDAVSSDANTSDTPSPREEYRIGLEMVNERAKQEIGPEVKYALAKYPEYEKEILAKANSYIRDEMGKYQDKFMLDQADDTYAYDLDGMRAQMERMRANPQEQGKIGVPLSDY